MRGAALVAAAAVLAGGCARDAETAPVELRVLAASSLTESFTALAAAFERAHPDVDVQLAFAGSQVLRLQIEQGVSADLFAAADPDHVAALVAAGLAEDPATFARNRLVIAVPAASTTIARFADLPRAERLVVGDAAVPIGRYTRALLARASASHGADFAAAVRARVVSEETNVRLVRAKVALGEADAAVVYATDVSAEAGVRAVPVPEALSPPVAYRFASLTAAEQPAAARRFAAFGRGPAGRAVLEAHGFLAP